MSGIKYPSKITIQMSLGALILFGLISAFMLNYSLYPVVKNPALSIVVDYPGADSDTVESIITIPIENQISTIGGITEIRSNSEKGKSLIRLDFENEANIDIKILEIKERIEAVVNTFPKEVRKPRVLNFDPNEMPIAVISLRASDTESLGELREFADSIIKKSFEGIEGVSKVTVSGGKIKEILISFDMQKLNAYNISLSDLYGAIHFNNRSSTIASVEEKGGLYQVRLKGKFSTLNDLAELPITSLALGKTVTLDNVAQISNSYRDEENTYRVNGNQNIGIYIYKKHDANILQISADLKKTIPNLSQNGRQLDILFNQAENIRDAYFNLLLIVLITFSLLFYVIKKREISHSIRIVFVIIFQFTLSFLLFSFIHYILKKDFDLLCSLSIYLSFIVWVIFHFNAQTVTNSFTEKNDKRKLILFSAIGLPVLFLPSIIINTTIAENLFRMGLLISLGFVSNYLIFEFFFRDLKHENNLDMLQVTTIPEYPIKHPLEIDIGSLRKNKKGLMLISLFLILFIWTIFSFLRSSKEIYFNVEDDRIYGYVELPSDSSFNYTDEVVKKIELKLIQNDRVKDVISQVDPGHAFLIINYHKSFLFNGDIIPSLNETVGKQNPAFCYFTKESELGRMKEISLDIVGPSHSDLNTSVPQIASMITNFSGIQEVILNFKPPRNELQLDLNNRNPLLQNSEIGSFLRTVVQGSVVSKFSKDSSELDIRIRASKEFRDSEKQLNKFLIKNNIGQFSPLENSYTQKESTSPIKLYRKNKRPSLSMSIRTDSYSATELLKRSQEVSKNILNGNERIELNNRMEKLSKSNTSFVIYLILLFSICFFLFIGFTDSLSISFGYLCSLAFAYCTFLSVYLLFTKTYDISLHIGSIVIIFSLMVTILSNNFREHRFTSPVKWDLLGIAFVLYLPLLIAANPELMVIKKVIGYFVAAIVLSKFFIFPFNFSNSNLLNSTLRNEKPSEKKSFKPKEKKFVH